MNPILDQILVAGLVIGAAAFFVVRFLRRRASGKACASDCGCSATKPKAEGAGNSVS